MRMIARPVALFAALAVVVGCGVQEEEAPGATVSDSAGVRMVELTSSEFQEDSAWQVEPEPLVDLSRPSTGAQRDFYRVSDIARLPDGSIIVAESGSGFVRRFSPEGELLAESGGEGDGPGEYRALGSVHTYRSDSVVAFDSWLGRATILSDELQVGRTVQFPAPYAGSLSPLSDGTFVVQFSFPSVLEYEGEGGVNRTPLPVLRYSADGEEQDTLGMLPGSEELMVPSRSGAGWSSMVMLFGKRSFVATAGAVIIAGSSDDLSFDVLAPDGSLLTRTRVSGWDQSVTPEMFEAEKNAFVPADAGPDVRRRVEERFAPHPFPESRPAFESLLVDADEYVWLARTKGRANYYGATRWEIFSPSGEWYGAVATPPRFIVYHVGRDQIIGVWLDDLDVEHPQVLRVSR
jgi:hypothetical protein